MFIDLKFRYRLRRVQGKNELLAKAIGLKKEFIHVFDTTAGLGHDALILSALGCHVTMFERHPEVFNRLEQGLLELSKDIELAPLVARMSIKKSCAIEYLEKNYVNPDVIYCDPMFEPKNNRALTKKPMQELQKLIGHDDDANNLIAIALKRAKNRVVVKRANYCESFPQNPNVIFRGRSHRFDVYCVLKT
jgi:16S rRNA (guanine1516-N2)-methyltransferase